MTPEWNQDFTIDVEDYNHAINFIISEKEDAFGSDVLAEGSFTAKQFSTPETTKEFQSGY